MFNIWDIIKGILSNFIFYIIVTAGLGSFFYSNLTTIKITLNGFQFFLLIIIIAILIYFLSFKKKYRVIADRETSMKENTKLMQQRRINYVFSTRLTAWEIADKSEARYRYRNVLTEIIQKGILTKRLWQINSKGDIQRLKECIKFYKEHDNYNIKVYNRDSPFIPEITLVNGTFLAVSIPQPENPRKMSITFQFKNKKDISFWESYFNILWENAISIKIGRNIFENQLKKIEEDFRIIGENE